MSHQAHDLSLIDTLGSAHALAPELIDLGHVSGAMTLPTCNRFEVMIETSDPATALADLDSLVLAGTSVADFSSKAVSFEGSDAVRHLFEVAGGLDSMVVGEREVVAQIRRAHREAGEAGTLSDGLSSAVRAALRTSREISVQTELRSRGRSLVSVALDVLASLETIPDAGGRVLLAGTGAYAGASVAALRDRGWNDIRVWSESGRAVDFALGHNVEVAGQLDEELTQADVVVLCRGKGAPVLTYDLVADSLAESGRPKAIVDLALAGDADPRIADLSGITLLDLDAVSRLVPAAAEGDLDRAQAILEAGLCDYLTQREARAMDPSILAVRQWVGGALERELEQLPASGTISAEDAARALRRMAATIAHVPSVAARKAGQDGEGERYAEAVRLLLGLEAGE